MIPEPEWIFLKLLCNRYHKGNQEPLRAFMDEESLKRFDAVSYASQNPKSILFQPEALLSSVHYSWLKPVLQEVPESLRPLIMRVLPIQLSLGDEGVEKEAASEYPEQVKYFLLQEFFRCWKEKYKLPKELLPQTKLSPLLQYKKQELVDIVDALAMYDIIDDVRHVVEQKTLKRMLEPLSKAQRGYLKMTLHQKQQIITEPLYAEKLSLDKKKYMRELHRRGLKRLASGLSQQDENFIWYITHTFDIGRGALLEKFIKKEENEAVLKIVESQILQVLQFLKSDSESKK